MKNLHADTIFLKIRGNIRLVYFLSDRLLVMAVLVSFIRLSFVSLEKW